MGDVAGRDSHNRAVIGLLHQQTPRRIDSRGGAQRDTAIRKFDPNRGANGGAPRHDGSGNTTGSRITRVGDKFAGEGS